MTVAAPTSVTGLARLGATALIGHRTGRGRVHATEPPVSGRHFAPMRSTLATGGSSAPHRLGAPSRPTDRARR